MILKNVHNLNEIIKRLNKLRLFVLGPEIIDLLIVDLFIKKILHKIIEH